MRYISLVIFVTIAAITLFAALPAEAQQPTVANVAPQPPPGGLTQMVSGTTDIQALIAAQTFTVVAVWRLNVATQEFEVYVPGAPSIANTLIELTVVGGQN